MRFFLFILYWTFYVLPLKVLSILFLPVPGVRERLLFEKKNGHEDLARSFRHSQLNADLCFEFSSEGEYQQVASLIDDALKASKRLELVFFSPSVEKTILELASRHPGQIRYLRYPLLSFGFSQWTTASTLILVRYDLFPEFLLWAMKPGHRLKMIWVSFKRERVKGKGVSFFKKLFLRQAEKIFYASEADQRLGESLQRPGSAYDFRIEQIRRRMSTRMQKFDKSFSLYPQLQKKLEEYPRDKRLIIGNAWPSDLEVLKHLPKDVLAVIVPHQLRPEIIQAFKDGMTALGREMIEVSEGATAMTTNTILINKKGILCELYADFGKAYVGGGFETSIHSVLEPLVAGAEALSCGPINFRSTEFDVADSMGKITEVRTSEDFLAWLQSPLKTSTGAELESVFANYLESRRDVISC